MNHTRPTLTEKTAAIAYARAFNTRDLSLFAPLVHRNLLVSDQLQWHQLRGGDLFLSVTRNLFECVPRMPVDSWMELASLPHGSKSPGPTRPCVVAIFDSRPKYTVLFRVHRGKIRFIERRLLPSPTDCRLSGVYPGIDDDLDQVVN
jgi:hypothetical protein